MKFLILTAREDADRELAAAEDDSGYDISSVIPIEGLPESPLVEARFVDPVTMTVTATLAVIAVRMVNHWLESRERGVQIDLQTVPATISRLEGVPAGVIVVVGKDGHAKVLREEYDKPEDLLPTLQGLLAAANPGQ